MAAASEQGRQQELVSNETTSFHNNTSSSQPNLLFFCAKTSFRNVSKEDDLRKIKIVYSYLCPSILFICSISMLFNSLLIYIRHNMRDRKTSVVLLSLNLAVTDMIAAFLNGIGIITNSYLPGVYGCRVSVCLVLVCEIIRCSALAASALHLLALAIVHYQGTFRPLLYRSEVFCSQHLSRTINIISLICWIIPITIFTYECSTTKGEGFWTEPGEPCDIEFMRKSKYRNKLCLVFVLPLLIMSVLYARIIPEIRRIQRANQNNLSVKLGCNSVTSNLLSNPAPNLPQVMGPNAAATSGRPAPDVGPGGPASGRATGDKSAADAGDDVIDGPKQWQPGNRSMTDTGEKAGTHNASVNIKFNLNQQGQGLEERSGLVQATTTTTTPKVGDCKIHHYSGRAANDNNNNCDHRGQPTTTTSGNNGGGGGEKLLVAAAASSGSRPPPTGAARLSLDEASSSNNKNGADSNSPQFGGTAASCKGCSSRLVNDGPDWGLTATTTGNWTQSAGDGSGKSVPASDEPDDCCLWQTPTDGDSSSTENPSRLDEARRSQSCRSQTPRVALRTQFSLLAPPTSPKQPTTTTTTTSEQPRLPSKSSLKKHHLTFDQKQQQQRLGGATKGTGESTRECRECDNKLRQLSVRLAHSGAIADGDQQHSNIDRGTAGAAVGAGEGEDELNERDNTRQGTLVTMSITSQGSRGGSSSISTSSVGSNSNRKRPKLGRSMTSTGASDRGGMRQQQQQQQQHKRRFFIGSIVGGRKTTNHQSTVDDDNNLSRQPSTTLTNACSVAGGSSINTENYNSNNNKQDLAVPPTTKKALITTSLILGTYFCGYGPALLLQFLTCADGCSVDIEKWDFEWKVLAGTSTTIGVILKSLIDPLIYSFRMSEIKNVIRNRLRRRSRAMRSSQRLQSSIYTNNTIDNYNSNHNSIILKADTKSSSANKKRKSTPSPLIGSLRILKRQDSSSTTSDNHKASLAIRLTNSSADDSPSRRLAKRYQSFDKYDYCPVETTTKQSSANSETNKQIDQVGVGEKSESATTGSEEEATTPLRAEEDGQQGPAEDRRHSAANSINNRCDGPESATRQ